MNWRRRNCTLGELLIQYEINEENIENVEHYSVKNILQTMTVQERIHFRKQHLYQTKTFLILIILSLWRKNSLKGTLQMI